MTLEVSILKSIRAEVDGRELVLRRQSQNVLAALVIHHERPLTTQALCRCIWPTAKTNKSNQLRTVLAGLRDDLGDEGYRIPQRGRTIDLTGTVCDAVALKSAIDTLDHDGAMDTEIAKTLRTSYMHLREADLANHPLFFSEFVTTMLQNIRRVITAKTHAPTQEFATLVTTLVRDNPADELLVRIVTELMLRQGAGGDAMKTLRDHKTALQKLGRNVSNDLTDLEAKILRNSPDLPVVDRANIDLSFGNSLDVTRRPHFVGRASELTIAKRSLAAGQSVLVVGEAGIGKSYFLAETLSQTARPNMVATCFQDDENYSAFRRLLPNAPITIEHTAEQVFEIVANSLRDLGPTAIGIEDLHNGDAGSLRVAQLLIRSLPTNSGLIATTRPSGAHHVRCNHKIALPLFGEKELRSLLETTGRTFTNADAHRLAMLTSGLPLLAAELVQRFELDGPTAWAAGAGHDSVAEQLVESLLEGRSPESRKFLFAAALLGDPIDLEAVREVLNMSANDATTLLDDAVVARLIEERDGLYFRHELVRLAIVHLIRPGERTLLHSACANALKGRSEWAAGRHLLWSAGVVPLEDITERVQASAAAAMHQQRNNTAAELYDGLLHLLEQRAALPSDLAVRLNERSAQAWERSGQAGRGIERRMTVLALAERYGREDWAHLAIQSAPGNGRSASENTLRTAMLRRGLMLLSEDSHLMAAKAELVVLLSLSGQSRSDEVRELVDALTALALDESQSPATRALSARAVCTQQLDVIDATLRHRCTEVLFDNTADDDDDIDVRSDAHAFRFRKMLELGRISEFDAAIPGVEAFLNRCGRPVDVWGAQVFQSCAAEMRGRISEAHKHAISAYQYGIKYDVSDAKVSWQTQVLLWGLQGISEPGLPMAEPQDDAADDFSLPGVIAEAYATAFFHFLEPGSMPSEKVIEIAQRLGESSGHLAWIPSLSAITEVVSDTGNQEAARSILPLLQGAPNIFVLAGISAVVSQGPLYRTIAQLEQVIGNFDNARTAYLRAIELCRIAGATRWEQDCNRRLAECETVVEGSNKSVVSIADRAAKPRSLKSPRDRKS
jgi:DNA-binding SARP family transcriptional activator